MSLNKRLNLYPEKTPILRRIFPKCLPDCLYCFSIFSSGIRMLIKIPGQLGIDTLYVWPWNRKKYSVKKWLTPNMLGNKSMFDNLKDLKEYWKEHHRQIEIMMGRLPDDSK